MRLKSYLSSVLLAFLMCVTMLPESTALAQSESEAANIGGPSSRRKRTSGVPEIEVVGLVAAGTLLVGGLAIAAARRRKNRKA